MKTAWRTPINLKTRILIGILRPVVTALIKLIAWSLKIEYRGLNFLHEAMASGRPVIVCAWHGNLTGVIMASTGLHLPIIVTMVSRSKDGEIAAKLTEPFGLTPVRGSSSKGGAIGLLEFKREMKRPDANGQPRLALHLIDGPRGPRHQSKPGIVPMAQLTNALIIPLELGMSRRKMFRSWDKHRLPYPFARLTVLFAPAIDLNLTSPEPEENGMKKDRIRQIETAMDELSKLEPLCRADYEAE